MRLKASVTIFLRPGGDPRVRGRAGADSGSFAGAGRYAGKENGVEGRD